MRPLIKCYGSLSWNRRFSNFLKNNGFKQLKTEQCLFVKESNNLILGIYVDDGILVGENLQEMEKLLKELKKKEFQVTIEKDPKLFIGMEIDRKEDGLKLTQTNYGLNVLKRYQMENSKPTATPMQKSNNNVINELKNTNYPYREAVGSILYLSSKTRPDLAYGVGYVSRYVENPTEEKIINIKRILRYLNGTVNQGIKYKTDADEDLIEAYTDSDFAGDPETIM